MMQTYDGWGITDEGAHDVYAFEGRVDADLAFWDALLAARASIADLRRNGYALAAGIQRDVMMSAFEAWLDPAAGVFRADLQAQQRSLAAESARDIDPTCEF